MEEDFPLNNILNMKTHQILNLSFLCAAAVLPVYGSNYDDAYAQPLYNNEDVDLPAWVKEEFADINLQLRNKLSPEDYLEILKGEYFLFSKYPTRKQYNKNFRADINEPKCRTISECKKKLLEILENPEDVKIFSRAYIPQNKEEGIYFRDHLRYNGGQVFFEHDKGVLTRTAGEMDAFSSYLTCWDPRTAREISSISLPNFAGSDSFTLCATTKNGDLAYYVQYIPAEACAYDWSGNYFGSYVWLPGKGQFQRLMAIEWEAKNYLRAFSNTKTGDIYRSLNLKPGAFNVMEGKLTAPWFKKTTAGLSILGNELSTDPLDCEQKDAYISAYSEGSSVCLTHTFGRDSNKAAKKSFTYCVNFDTLELQRIAPPTEQEQKEANDVLISRLKTAMVPNPVSCAGGTCDFFNPEDYDAAESIARGEGSNDYVPFALIYCHYDEGTSAPSSIIGILTNEDRVYLYDWEDLRKGHSAKLRDYNSCVIPRKSEFDGNLIESVQEEFAPYVRQHTLRFADNGFIAEVVLVLEWGDGKAQTFILDLNTQTFEYKVRHHFESPQKFLCPVWLPEKQWFLKPISDVCYDIMKVDESGNLDKIADFYVDPNRGYAIVLPNGLYAGSPGCENFLAFREGNKSVGLSALAPWKNRPAEVLEALGGNEDDITALRETTKRWLHKLHMTESASTEAPSLASLPVAKVELPELYTKEQIQTLTVQLEAAPLKAMTSVEVYAEGKRIPQEWDDTLLVRPGEQKTVTVQVPLAVGQNWLEIRPVDSMGVAGDTTKFRVIHEDVTQPSELYIVALGVSDYENDNEDLGDLRYAAKDAQDITDSFAKHAKSKVHTLVLTDKEVADVTVLQKVKDFFADSRMNDQVILYVAGHGFLDENLDYRYATAGFDTYRLEETGISMDALVDAIKSAPARKGLLLLDTCHSGTLGEAGEEELAKNAPTHTATSRNKRTRGMKLRGTSTMLKSERQNKRYIEDMFSTGTTYRGINIIAGAAGAELAQEGEEWNNGVFTACIMQTLENIDEADKNADSTLTVDELQNHVLQLVQKYTKGNQKPTVVTAEDNPMSLVTPSIPWLSEVKQRIADYATAADQKTADWEKVRQWSRGEYSAEDATEVLLALAKYDMPEDIATTLLSRGGDADAALLAMAESHTISIAMSNMAKAFEFGATAAAATECLTKRFGYEYLSFLRRHGADFKAKGTELLHSCTYNRSQNEAQSHLRCLQLILSEGVNVNTQDRHGNTALHNVMRFATEYDIPIIDALLLAGANPNIRNNEGKRPQEPGDRNYRYLQQRAEYIRNNPGAVRVPTGSHTEAQTFLNTITNYSPSNETMKLYKKRLTMLLPMIINGADVNVTTTETKGNTALHYAAGMGYYDLVEWLVNNGAEINRKTNRGKTPLDCVGNDPGNRIRNFLKNRGAVKSN